MASLCVVELGHCLSQVLPRGSASAWTSLPTIMSKPHSRRGASPVPLQACLDHSHVVSSSFLGLSSRIGHFSCPSSVLVLKSGSSVIVLILFLNPLLEDGGYTFRTFCAPSTEHLCVGVDGSEATYAHCLLVVEPRAGSGSFKLVSPYPRDTGSPVTSRHP